MNIWVDDIRPAPEGYVWCKSTLNALHTIYHNADEFLGIYPFLKKEVPNYRYKVRALSGLSEVTLIGYPAELTDKTASEF